MIIDLHAHSVKSDDGRAKVQNYCQWIQSKNIPIDGFVLTEHRQFDDESDYSDLAKKFNLVFGVTPPLKKEFDFGNIHLALSDVIEACNKHNAIAIPCHPGRKRVGMAAHLEEFGTPDGVTVVEVYNGGSREDEDQIAQNMADELGYLGTGGSDAHIVSQIGKCATVFEEPIHTEADLVSALRSGKFTAKKLVSN